MSLRLVARWTLASLLLVIALLWLADRIWPLPLPQDDLARVVLAEDGTPLWRFADANGVWRYPVQTSEVSPYYLEALLTYEDRWFYQHPGVNPLALVRATWQNLTGTRVVSGGSTLSMQVARLLDPHSRTFHGKLRQLWRTAQLEWHLSKAEILNLYLNRAPFGGTLQGVAAASWAYLGKSPSQLTHAEAALLAVLPQAPSRLRPDRHPQRAQEARDKVLRRLAEFQVWPQAAVDEALEEPLLLAPRLEPSLAPLLARRLNRPDSPPLIRTTLDATLQRRLEDLLLGWRARLPEHTSAAILVVEEETMAVRAYLGSVDINDAKRFGHVDMISALRSPGSTLKPFLYGMALDDGLIHSESLLQDVPRRYGDYRPGNFSMGFTGAVPASTALSSSLNLPAVQLLEAYGPKRFAAEMRIGGVPLALPALAEPNLALILGGAGSRLEDLVSGYSAFARDGRSANIRLQPDDTLRERPLLSPGAAWIVRRILSGQARPDRDPRAELVQRPVLAWKTGTSYGFRDAWAIGVGPRYLIGVWIGRPDGTPVPGQFGLASAAPLMLQVHDVLTNRDSQRGISAPVKPVPANVGVAAICWPSGQPMSRSDPNCRRQRFAWTLDHTTPPTLQALDQPLSVGLMESVWVNAKGLRVDAHCPGAEPKTIALWPAPLEPWLPRAERREARIPAADPDCPPPALAASSPLSIVGIREGDQLRLPAASQQALRLKISALGGSGRRWWFLNGAPLGDSANQDFINASFERLGRYQLSVLDEAGQTARLEFSVVD
ncbi:peptidoglycan glycosyltransferase PbpC [Pseudomonas fluorescens group sp.]|uniref:peptidoglycan glycosyltransferase n=3 Tax=Pseudomonas fluorescens group TaxID=136843 RepID=C3K7E5_PSEFS|nr:MULTISPECIES: peptidoglycan glycosyltransferase PbpC [Pseudomonas fluorescens group]MBZ6458224.1 peptidoglycan glycosyltransferase PbpC [Pseudomonas fluorescens group sp.]MBZ6464778.1 peptidoglycan glycosyltransferase PbpC [Pseudomonas fluorescens group sp.]MBZ6469261.1 peptidoglycan glycosyltransferase PbpC [Pseudomonas fluorescens group sp.]WQD72969.1 peptidoglycan glycosyltransferase PbpC [Pseudomonas marginalis]CAI2794942.1 Penicillin-insensitive transglycosylase (EC (Peptidoglycan TGas